MTLAEEGHHAPLAGCLPSELAASPDALCSASLPCSVSWETEQGRPMNGLPCSLALRPMGSILGAPGEGVERGQGIYSPRSFLGVLPGELVAFLEPCATASIRQSLPYSLLGLGSFFSAPAGPEASLLVS